ncbi:ABC transporter, ATP-binding protein [Leptospira broomii serovar Hurstbridge str. 5399]|uniref:ABC transporter, ATP-binding protein n=1 Tax=Leptospira broomii serovar Hurstbridge str. 5399 TaxID=1049789 RepID=T0GLE7_9LEPT|nr:ABC-F family ATP-binding cassette domain-containing protein [Leptospira broomii]EQA46188.1 ABC transporter, ATP-binding protein [Leptospira broomii serovar Hurstbridge str. 5399]
MLQFIDIKHRFGSSTLFDKFSWHIKPGSKVALVGPNGSGKSTLFRMAEGDLIPEEGIVSRSKHTEISLFQQIPDFDFEVSVIETALKRHKHYNEYIIRSRDIHSRMDATDHDSPEFNNLLEEQSSLEEYAFTYGVHELEARARKIIGGLGFSNEQMERKVREFSPGYQHRLGLAIAILNPGNLLLLDEPTNHLDHASKEWLAEYLRSTSRSFVLVTHDPEFLNATTDTIAELNPSGVLEFKGTLEDYFEHKNELLEKLRVQFQKEEAYLKKRTEWVERFRAKATKARAVQSVIKKLEKRERVEAPEDSFWNSKTDYTFNYIPCGNMAFRVEDADFSYDGKKPDIFEGAELHVSTGDKIAVIGPNGAGKSTFLRCILGIHKLSKGVITFGPKTKIGYFSQNHHEDLDPNKSLLETVLSVYPDMSEVEARSLLGYFSFSDDRVYKKVGLLSGGEQSRLRLALLVKFGSNCLFLDEPTNHLDLVVRDNLKRALQAYPGAVLVISHDPEFLKDLCNRTISVSGGKIRDLNTSFADYLRFPPEDLQSEGGVNKPQEPSQSNESKDKTRSQRNADKNRVKKIQKEIEQIESKIALLEKNKSNSEELLADPQFYKNRSYQLELDTYNQTKLEIGRLTEQWESLQLELEELSAIV